MDEPITWEEHQKRQTINSDYTLTNILCPKCGEFLYRYDKVVLTTYPPKHRYECLKCGWWETGW